MNVPDINAPSSALLGGWVDVSKTLPPMATTGADLKNKPYVLAVDKNGRMSVGYLIKYSSENLRWTFAKPIGEVTHWMKLPEPPNAPGERPARTTQNVNMEKNTHTEGEPQVRCEELLAALAPVLDWYQSDEQPSRPVLDIVRDVVSDLQSDRKAALAVRRLVTANEALGVMSENKMTYYEESPTKNAECYRRWVELNAALVNARAANAPGERPGATTRNESNAK